MQGVKFNVDETGKIVSYTTEVGGADSEFPFTDTSDATAVAANITKGKTAYVNGVKITGTRPAPVTTLTGSGSLTAVSVGSSKDYTVTFSSTFDTIPSVLITPTVDYITLKVLSVTRGGFTFRQTCTSALSGKYNWTATG